MTLSDELADAIVARLQAEVPGLEAVLLAGSYARGEADELSDVDVVAVTRDAPALPYFAWFLERPEGRLLHVSVAAESLEEWDEEDAAPAKWALGFPALDVMTWLWGTPRAKAALGDDPGERLPAGTPELEDFVDLFLKVRRAGRSDDTVVLRWAARKLGEYGVGLLRPLNPQVVVRSPPEAWRAALALPVAPAHFGEDFEVCAGLRPASDAAVAEAAARLTREMLALLEPRAADLGLDDPTIEAALREGVLRRYIET